MTQLICCCPWWGLDHLGIEGMMAKIKGGGFDAVEIGVPKRHTDRSLLKRLLDLYDLKLVVHQYVATGNTAKEYIQSLRKELEVAASFRPLVINSHTGKDYWDFEDGCRVFEEAEEIGQKYGVTIAHETHRGRLLYSAPVARRYMEELEYLKINADFSHWVNVSESLLEDQKDTMELAISRTEHTHARIGYAQGPQITDPRASEWEKEINTFSYWWKRIMESFIRNERKFMTFSPEFGPYPYTVRHPFTLEPLSDPWSNNLYMKDQLKNMYNQISRTI
ncbi:sugar phosphate isomerase/epimerase family protein [Echinicola shivajiensis]|uniref:sugar phosphate isomerase/epimerase family protein n=1 Tax=Echinicola shivajiensis TaxID=1035916 RepID=UPI001BFC26B3|nr:sugar phosphate isomerase/epimerase [Echinicola shivajiensis]